MKRDNAQRPASRGKESLNSAEYKILFPTLGPKVGEHFLLLMTFVSGKERNTHPWEGRVDFVTHTMGLCKVAERGNF